MPPNKINPPMAPSEQVQSSLPPSLPAKESKTIVLGMRGRRWFGRRGRAHSEFCRPRQRQFLIAIKKCSGAVVVIAILLAHRIWCCQCQLDACIGVGIEGQQGGRVGGQDGDVFLRRLIVELGSHDFLWWDDVLASTHYISAKKHGTPTILRSI